MPKLSATYDPQDNKIRLYSVARLDQDLYKRVVAAGFKYAPAQGLFVAPMWTPEREDLLLELCGEIGDEDNGLVDRAEERAERFEEYAEHRERDAKTADATARRLADAIPMGQPILIGHHSERRHRRDLERIQNNATRAINNWDTARYWERRAQAAIRHALYKEQPAVRARRIKTIEADERKQARVVQEAQRFIKAWSRPNLTLDQALQIANFDHVYLRTDEDPTGTSAYSLLKGETLPVDQIAKRAIAAHEATIARAIRWLNHYRNRLAYERAMLAADGGIESDTTKPEKGGACRCWVSRRGSYSHIVKVNAKSVTVLDNFGNGGPNFTRTVPFDKLTDLMTAAEVEQHRTVGTLHEYADGTGFVLTQPIAASA